MVVVLLLLLVLLYVLLCPLLLRERGIEHNDIGVFRGETNGLLVSLAGCDGPTLIELIDCCCCCCSTEPDELLKPLKLFVLVALLNMFISRVEFSGIVGVFRGDIG